ncbi:hypothetical protein GT044_12565, partial [Streptomyces sp. SID335]|nr:hypothetical protein [Streptomyces sp. SID335]
PVLAHAALLSTLARLAPAAAPGELVVAARHQLPLRPDVRPPRLRPCRQQRRQHSSLLISEISPPHEPRSFTGQDPLSIHDLVLHQAMFALL